MSKLEVTLYIRSGNERITHKELMRDGHLRKQVNLENDPIGGICIANESSEILLDDTIGMVSQAFLYKAPALLREGKSYTYRMRQAQGSLSLHINNGTATVTNGSNDTITVSALQLAEAFENLKPIFESLMSGK